MRAFNRIFPRLDLVVVILFCLLITPVSILSVSAQSNCNNANCQNPPPQPDSWVHWAKGANVTVVIDNTFTQQEIAAITTAFNNWEAANGANGNNSGVNFTVTVGAITGTPSSGQLQVRNQSPPSNSTLNGIVKAQSELTHPKH